MAYRDVVLSDSPIEYWEFNEASGSTLDSVGSGNHDATATGTTVISAGKVGNAREFDGVDDTVTAANVADFMALTSYTVECWVRYNNVAGMDYPTFFRRDGNSKTFLVRTRANTVGRENIIEAYVSGRTVDTGTTTFNDGLWHHVVVTKSSTTVRLFVDGVEYTTGNGSVATGGSGTAATTYIGRGTGATEFFKGGMDEVAIYSTALSPTRITAHYNAAQSTDAGYTAQVMTASAAMPGGTGAGNAQNQPVVDDTYVIDGDATNYSTSTSLSAISGRFIFLHLPAMTAGQYELDTKLYLDPTSAMIVPTTFNIYSVNAAWSAATINGTNEPSLTLVRSVTVTEVVNNRITLDITGADTGNGIAISGGGTYHSLESTEGQPYIRRSTTTNPPWVTVAATPLTASVNMPESTVAAGADVSVGSLPMTASADIVDPVVQIIASGMWFAQPMDAQAIMKDANFALTINAFAEPMTASAETVDPAVGVAIGAVINAVPMKATSNWIKPSLVNDMPVVIPEAEDPFFNAVMAASPYRWFRLNDTGSVAVDRMGVVADNPTQYVGVQTGQFEGPNGRHSVYFDNGAYMYEPDPYNTLGAGGASNILEFSIRTTKKNQFLMATNDETAGTVSTSPAGVRELFMKDGRIGYRYFGTKNPNEPKEFVGFKDIADGEWHRITVISEKGPSSNELNNDVTIYIDGQHEIRRGTITFQWTGFPDYIGNRPSTFTHLGGWGSDMLPASGAFVGDMSEVVLLNDLSVDKAIRRYYTFMGWNPIGVDPVEAFAFMTDGNAGRGNQKRALYLWWDETVDKYNYGGGLANNKMNFDPLTAAHGKYGVYDFEDYKVFSMGVTKDRSGFVYRDPATDLPSLIDLEYHVDMNDYDVIMFGDWPDEGFEEDLLEGLGAGFEASKEKLIRQLRDANEVGVGLLVTHPRLAVDLGVVDRVEFVPTLKERFGNIFTAPDNIGFQGNATGSYDYGSAVKFPWNITDDSGVLSGTGGGRGTGLPMNTDPAFLDYKAYFYEDHNFNNRFRVRSTVNGLTDIPSYIIKDAVVHTDRDSWGETTVAWNLEDRRGGLLIGDEFIFHGTNAGLTEYDGSGTFEGLRRGRPYGYYAVPPTNVKSGTVVTTFGATYWKGKAEVENPYKDYATTIALDRGSVLAGRPVGGRIFVSFTEGVFNMKSGLLVDILPGSEWDDGSAVWPNEYRPDTPAQRDWELSMTRVSGVNRAINGNLVETSVVMPDGSTSVTRSIGDGLVTSTINLFFRRAVVPKWDMTRRGIWWVGRGEEPAPGEKRVAGTPMTATAAMPQPTVVAQKDGGFTAEPMSALAQMTRVAESTVGDVEVRMLPMTARAEFTGFSRVVYAGAMEASAELVENFNMVHASGEQVVLTLHGVDATLYLKEEA